MKKRIGFSVLILAVVAAAGLVVFFLLTRGAEPELPQDSSGSALSQEQQRQLLLDAGMTENQADSFLAEKEDTVADSGAITQCIFRENTDDYYVVTDTNRGFSLTVDGGFPMSNQLTYTVSFQGDAIDTLRDYNDVAVIEGGERTEHYAPVTPQAVLAAEKVLRQQIEALAEEWYNTVPCPAERGTEDWLTIDRVTFDDVKNVIGDGTGFTGGAVSIQGGQTIIPCWGTVSPTLEHRDNEPTWRNFQSYGTFTQGEDGDLQLISVTFKALPGVTISYGEKTFLIEAA